MLLIVHEVDDSIALIIISLMCKGVDPHLIVITPKLKQTFSKGSVLSNIMCGWSGAKYVQNCHRGSYPA